MSNDANPEQQQPPPDVDWEQMRSRPHHYQFAYKVFPQFVMYDPKKFRDMALSGDLVAIIRKLWVRMGEQLPEELRLPPGELACQTDEYDGYTRVIVIMPRVQRPIECIFIAVLVRTFPSFLFFKRQPDVSFFTLEKSYPEAGVDTNVVAFMTTDGTHGNFGKGPDTLAGFKEWLDARRTTAKIEATSRPTK